MHRDIKLDNIFVKLKESVEKGKDQLTIDKYDFKLGDFGLAKRFSTQDDRHITFCGTPLHMAP